MKRSNAFLVSKKEKNEAMKQKMKKEKEGKGELKSEMS